MVIELPNGKKRGPLSVETEKYHQIKTIKNINIEITAISEKNLGYSLIKLIN